MNQTLPRTYGLLPNAGEQSHHENKTTEVDSRVAKCAGARKQSHVVTRFCTDIRFARLLSLISAYSVVFTSFL